jgi:diguanylate cyclase (GGDEF)-like protein
MLNQQEADGMAEQALITFSHHAGDKPIVLIADDSRVVRVSLKNILKDNCQIMEAENGQVAWDILCNTPSITLVFSDLSMPKLDGRGLLNKIRHSDSDQIAHIPFIVITGNEEGQEIRQELAELGANEVINKPFDPSNIRNFLTTYGNRNQDTERPETDDSQQEALEPQSDFLHGVVDREHFMESASRELAFAIRNKNELAVALVRLDQIDEIKSHYSDPAIEHILLTLVEIIKQHIHPDDSLAYFGNGLFAILRPASNAIGTRYLGRRILEDLSSKQFYLGESEQIVSASIGISAPDIKPGTRLIELLSLVESRLNTAIENGGNKVVDKGNEPLTQINLVGDTSELSGTTRSQPESTRSASEQVAEIKDTYSNELDGEDDEASALIEYRQTIERLTNENRQLINEIAHWKKQSAEAENLRRQLFEVESQQQQLQIRFSALQNENLNLAQEAESKASEHNSLLQRTEAVENENRNLLKQTKTATRENNTLLQQAETVARENKDLLQRIQILEIENQTLTEGSLSNSNSDTQQFIEKENGRLANQLTELTRRAEKAEVANHQSSQLVNSLNDNIKLLNMQLDQLQQQLTEEQQKNQTTVKPRSGVVGRDNSVVDTMSKSQSFSESISDSENSNLLLKPLPDSKLNSANSEPPGVHLFPEKDQIQSKKRGINKSTFPPFRVEPRPLLFKNGFHLSSFAIAGLIFIVMLTIGGIYLSHVLHIDHPVATVSEQVQADSQKELPAAPVQPAQQATTTKTLTNMDTGYNTVVSDETRLEKELILRKMAEEEFNLKVQ